jgi:hypothetical protein
VRPGESARWLLHVVAVSLVGCATLGRVADLARVDFFIDRT